jgi:N-acetylglucosaminyldiphosphoundecaprenol N-acetyl-beta-D-mannosaminyltransferase
MEILGVKISDSKLKDIDYILRSDRKYFLTTLNPEIILRAQKDEEYFYILNQADINLVDGYGLKLACLLIKKKVERITGADLTIELLNKAEKLQKKVLIINYDKGLSSKEEIKRSLENKWPNLNFSVINKDRHEKIINDDLEADIMFVNFGAPYQEKFIYHNLDKVKGLKLALGVGGSFDFITNKVSRAPLFLRKIGLEWLWRLIKQPKRIIRIFKATIFFTYKVIAWRYFLPHIYRPNVVCFIYRKINDRIEILLVERRDQEGYWQLPQGGLDGQSIIKGGLRESKEELNIFKLAVKKVYRNLYRYNFNDSISKYGHKGQKQNLLILKYLGNGGEIKINYFDHRNYMFVPLDKFINKIAPIRREAAKMYLDKFKKHLYEKK